MVKSLQKNQAIELRKIGLSYNEILRQVPVAKSTLSLWLREVGIAKRHIIKNTQKRIDAALRGALKRKNDRIILTENIKKDAALEIGKLRKKIFWLVGAALYWAEGSKQKEHSVSTRTLFTNSDPEMVAYFHKWLLDFCKVSLEDIGYELYIHHNGDIERALEYWSRILKIDKDKFPRARIKKGNIKSFRKNKGNNYYGVVRIHVKRSTNLNRKIMGWVQEVFKQYSSYSGVV